MLGLRTGRGLLHDRAVPIDLDRDLSRGCFVARVTGVLTIEELITFLTTARASRLDATLSLSFHLLFQH